MQDIELLGSELYGRGHHLVGAVVAVHSKQSWHHQQVSAEQMNSYYTEISSLSKIYVFRGKVV